jgi:hypothetical protein
MVVGFWNDLHHGLSPSSCVGLDLSVSVQGQLAGFCDHDDEPLPVKCRGFLGRLGNSQAYQDKN